MLYLKLLTNSYSKPKSTSDFSYRKKQKKPKEISNRETKRSIYPEKKENDKKIQKEIHWGTEPSLTADIIENSELIATQIRTQKAIKP